MDIRNSRAKPLGLIVGREAPARDAVAHELLARGYAVVMCSGPPGCALAHEDTCALVGNADVTIILSQWQEAHGGHFLRECAVAADKAIFAWSPPFPVTPGAVVVGSRSPGKIADAADRLVRRGAA